MSDFVINNDHISCTHLRINGKLFPREYNTDGFLKYSISENKLLWSELEASLNLNNEKDTSGIQGNYYMIMNNSIGGESSKFTNAITNDYLRLGIGNRTSGPDGKGTGISPLTKGQITLGLTKEDTSSLSDIKLLNRSTEYGSTLTDHLSLMSDGIGLIYKKKRDLENLDSGDFIKATNEGIKIDKDGYYKYEDGNIININTSTEDLYNKIINDPTLNGNLIFQEGNTNIELGFRSGGYIENNNFKTVSGILRSNKNLDIYANNETDYYKGWEIITTTNNIISSNIIEKYLIGHTDIKGSYKAPTNSKTVLRSNDDYELKTTTNYYNGWTLTNWSSSNIQTEYTITSSNSNYEIEAIQWKNSNVNREPFESSNVYTYLSASNTPENSRYSISTQNPKSTTGKLNSIIYGNLTSDRVLETKHIGENNGYYIGWVGTFTNTYTYQIAGLDAPSSPATYPVNSSVLYLGTGYVSTSDDINKYKGMSITGDGIPSNTTINEINNTNKSITLSNSITSSDLSVNTSITLTIISTGTITGYNKSSRSIQVCLSNTNHILKWMSA